MDNNNNSEQKNIKFEGKLWPPNSYFEQLKNLYNMLDKPVYIIPLHQNQKSLTFSITGKAIVLVAIIDYPVPDPENHIYPHMLVFNDGTGINLGRILQVSINRPFNPGKEDIIYEDKKMQNSLMYKERQLNEESIHLASRAGLSELLSIAHNNKALTESDKSRIKVMNK